MINRPSHQRQRGATLMEVLITMVIMLFGLIGLSQLFVKAQRTTNEAYDRHRALALANSMAEMTRSMMRLKMDKLTGGVSQELCPAPTAIPSSGAISNEQMMACLVQYSRNGGNGLGKFTDETAPTLPTVTLSTLRECENTAGCDGRKMALYMLNMWADSLSGIRQDLTVAADTNAVVSNKAFSARGCIDQICDAEGNVSAGRCAHNTYQNIYRVRVVWRSEEPITPDDAHYYCLPNTGVPDQFMRYTFVDVALPAPSTLPKVSP